MKKISLFTKIAFHISNIVLIALYLYPGSIMGWIIYKDTQKQPQLTSDFIIFSTNHVYAFMVLSLLGVISHDNKKTKILLIYLIFISIVLELCHVLIPERSFEYQDLLGNLFGVILIFILFQLYNFFKVDK
jgi:hypothetical protein